ncbi:hypothetical protein EDD80_11336 [Anseongella ginsenosidimutans]|uniref:Phosphatidate cytidylyltransferase n=1 Tax=Anseongella ginsenosidimutans TaxID=496056 RepID=A0A4R3KN24_9SPHI|nr:lipoprotein [Anseongella ginsenosidimutans]TCS85300.1 hypothetical protein EDD80_11336 [Anseongella ginsenosidimutans]
MKKSYFLQGFLFLFLLTVLSGCDLVAGIFEAGVWVGVILVVAVLVLIIWLLRKVFR